MCFPLDRTGKWYLLKHSELMDLVRENAPQWLESNKWKNEGIKWSYSGTKDVRAALEEFSYSSKYPDFGFRECSQIDK